MQTPSPLNQRKLHDTPQNFKRVAIVGGGWAGMAAAVYAAQAGHAVTLLEAAHHWGGRARTVPLAWPDEHGGTRSVNFDNGQHILIGAYSACFSLMRLVGASPEHAFLRLPLALPFADGTGLALPDWPAPFDAAWGIATAKGWGWADKLSLLRVAGRWRAQGFVCAPDLSVTQLCAGLSARLLAEFIDPLCVSALNTPASEASGQVFLRVLRDSLMGPRVGALGASNLMLPRRAMGALWCDAAAQWLQARGASLRLGHTVRSLSAMPPSTQAAATHPDLRSTGTCTGTGTGTGSWMVDGEAFDAVILATNAAPASRLVHALSDSLHTSSAAQGAQGAQGAQSARANAPQAESSALATQVAHWAEQLADLRFEAISTVYAQVTAHQKTLASGYHLPQPMLALRATAKHPAQFVFERDQLHEHDGHDGNRNSNSQSAASRALAFVVSASRMDRDALARAITAQAQAELCLQVRVEHVLVDKRATFCCTPGLQRPAMAIAPGLLACGDYVDGPYPATLEGAVRSAHAAVQLLPAA